VIQERSYSLLDEIAATVSSNAHLKKIRIEGHTDSVGSIEANRRLSKSRAQSVQQALESRGVDESRLAAVGFGEDQPIETNKTEEGRAANRRVEFIIIDQDLHTPQ
jgi:outer membrane protein OmpA-like peptidoglycan-associated protein